MLKESNFDLLEKQYFSNLINRFFDRVEIAFCSTWACSEQDLLIDELQDRNRQMTNEKNKYLTIFESLSMPVFIVDHEGKIENMNLAAANIFNTNSVSGSKYYTESKEDITFTEEFPWLAESYHEFVRSKEQKIISEKSFDIKEQYFHISFSRSLDISGKFSGTIIIIEDITKRKKMEEDLKKLATTDPLTGAKNRRSFLQLFEQELLRCQRYGHKLALLMIDIDHFKDVNDTHGHQTGDKVLQEISLRVTGKLPPEWSFYRMGGDEFAVIVESELTDAATERLLKELEKSCHDPLVIAGKKIRLSASTGIANFPEDGIDTDALLNIADSAMYADKLQFRKSDIA